MRMQRLNSYLIRLLLILGSLVAMLPIYMAVVNSFKTQGEMFESLSRCRQRFTGRIIRTRLTKSICWAVR